MSTVGREVHPVACKATDVGSSPARCSIKTLLVGAPTLVQLDILQRADVLFRGHCGRYFGGLLAAEEIDYLMPPKKEKS